MALQPDAPTVNFAHMGFHWPDLVCLVTYISTQCQVPMTYTPDMLWDGPNGQDQRMCKLHWYIPAFQIDTFGSKVICHPLDGIQGNPSSYIPLAKVSNIHVFNF
jgi:hypothetical protein